MRKIVTHDRYSFYNPAQHPEFAKEGGAIIFLEGTYSNFFAGNNDQTPRYDYNQIMYKLDLRDPRLVLPRGFIPAGGGMSADGLEMRPKPSTERPSDSSTAAIAGREIAFFALDRPGEGRSRWFSNRAGSLARRRPDYAWPSRASTRRHAFLPCRPIRTKPPRRRCCCTNLSTPSLAHGLTRSTNRGGHQATRGRRRRCAEYGKSLRHGVSGREWF